MENCLICERIEWIKEDKNPYLVMELETGYVVIGDHQYFKGYTVFLCREHVSELHLLERDFKAKFLEEMSLVGEAVYNTFNPDKLNYELLGNGDSHLHWHIFPRTDGDIGRKGPVWWLDKNIMYSDDVKPTDEELNKMKTDLLHNLKELLESK